MEKNFFVVQSEQGNVVYHALSSKMAIIPKGLNLEELDMDKLELQFPGLNKYTWTENSRRVGQGDIGIRCMSARQCNMSCKYCFADGGKYKENHEKPFVMSADLYMDTIKFFSDVYEKGIKDITFFGGEPLLGFEEIKKIIPRALDYYKAQNKQLPNFILSTNATLINEEIVQFLHSNKISVSLSLDGPEELNDQGRVFKNNQKRTYKKVLEAINLLNQSDIDIYLQVVLNRKHIEMESNDSFFEWIKQIESIKNLKQITYLPVSSNEEEYGIHGEEMLVKFEQLVRKLARYYIKKVVTEEEIKCDKMIVPMMYMVQNKIKEECNAGYSVYVDTDGEIYPCQMFCGSDQYLLGNVNSRFIDKERIINLRKINRHENETCKGCIAKGVCMIYCKGLQWLMNGDVEKVCDVRCVFQRTITEECIKQLSQLQKDTPEYDLFIKNMLKLFGKR